MRLHSLSHLRNWSTLQVFERKFFSPSILVRCFYCPGKSLGRVHLGIRASKKVGCAVTRNLLRRRILNIARNPLMSQNFHSDCVYLVSILPASSKISFLSLKQDFSEACQCLYKKVDSSVKRFIHKDYTETSL